MTWPDRQAIFRIAEQELDVAGDILAVAVEFVVAAVAAGQFSEVDYHVGEVDNRVSGEHILGVAVAAAVEEAPLDEGISVWQIEAWQAQCRWTPVLPFWLRVILPV